MIKAGFFSVSPKRSSSSVVSSWLVMGVAGWFSSGASSQWSAALKTCRQVPQRGQLRKAAARNRGPIQAILAALSTLVAGLVAGFKLGSDSD